MDVGSEKEIPFLFWALHPAQAAAIAHKVIRKRWPHVSHVFVHMDAIEPAPRDARATFVKKPQLALPL